MRIWQGIFLSLALLANCTEAETQITDPLRAKVDDSNVERFAKIYRETSGLPSAERLQEEYIDAGDRAIEIFTPGRIVDGPRLAKVIEERPTLYSDALDRCWPWVRESERSLTATYLAFRGLLPELALPKISIVIGANNSGGTAREDMQVLGLEVLCRLADSRQAFLVRMHHFYAHETVHTLQIRGDMGGSDRLLRHVLTEGIADYVAQLVTSDIPQPGRNDWAMPREKWIWDQFESDLEIYEMSFQAEDEKKMSEVTRRWVAYASSPPEGWPGELGYWLGRQIATDYVAQSLNPHIAIRELLVLEDPREILRKSGYAEKAKVGELKGPEATD